MNVIKLKPISNVIPWIIGFLGAVILVTALFLDTDLQAPNTGIQRIVKVSRNQLDRSLKAIVAENPKLREDNDWLINEMKKGAEAQSLLVAEAFRQGLAENDYIVRNRLAEIQVMVLYEKADAQVTPDAVKNYFNENRERYYCLSKRKVIHLFVPVTNQVNVDSARHRLDDLFNATDAAEKKTWVTEDQLRKSWGPSLAGQVFNMPLSQWSDPILSNLGWHRVKVMDETPKRLYKLEEVRARVTQDFRRDIRKKVYEAEISRLKKIYKITWAD